MRGIRRIRFIVVALAEVKMWRPYDLRR